MKPSAFPIPLPHIDWGGLGDALNPFKALNNLLLEFRSKLSNIMWKAYLDPPVPQHGAMLDYMYGEALGVADQLGIAVTIPVLVAGLFFQKYIFNVVQAIVMVVGLGLILPYFYAFCDWLHTTQIEWDKLIITITDEAHKNGGMLIYGADAGIISNIFAIMFIGTLGTIVVIILMFFGLVGVVSKFLFPIIWLLYPISEAARALLGKMLGVIFVATLLGTPAILLCLELGNIAEYYLGLGGFLDMLWEAGSYALAIWVIVKIMKSSVRAMVTKMRGGLNTRALVRGKVDTNDTSRPRTSVQEAANAAYGRGMKQKSMPVFMTAPPKFAGRKNALKSEAKYRGASAIAKVASKHPTSRVARKVHGVATHLRDKHEKYATTKGAF